MELCHRLDNLSIGRTGNLAHLTPWSGWSTGVLDPRLGDELPGRPPRSIHLAAAVGADLQPLHSF